MRKRGPIGVYAIKNIVNNKLYIGASVDIYNRLCDHKVALKKNIHINIHLQSAYNLYGKSKFKFEVLEECSKEDIFSLEDFWCKKLNTHNRLFGYNIDPTSPIGKTSVSDETRIKMCAGAEKRPVQVYTIYGEFFREFSDLYKCGEYFNTAASNIHRKMNTRFNKKNLIDSELTKYILADKITSIEEVKTYWNNIFFRIKECKGPYKVYDCFDNYIGRATAKNLSEILGVHNNSIANAENRGIYLKTLKFKRWT